MSDGQQKFIFYHYDPNLPAAIIFASLFSLTTIVHIVQTLRTKAWYMTVLVVGGIFEITGYAARTQSSKEKEALGPFVIQSVLLLVAPALFAASIYMTLGRIILLLDGEKYALIKKKWLTKVFVLGDVMSFFVQSGGAGIMAKGAKQANTGSKIIIGGLLIQVMFFGVFLFVAWHFYRSILPHRKFLTIPWQKHMYALFVVSSLIFVRSIFRIIEYAMGFDGYLQRHEVFLYVFDSCLMFGVMLLLNVFHPGEIASMANKIGSNESHEFVSPSIQTYGPVRQDA